MADGNQRRGGFKPGQSGNPAGRPTKVKQLHKLLAEAAKNGVTVLAPLVAEEGARLLLADNAELTAHGLLQLVYRNPALPLALRLEAARHAAPFEKPRLSSALNLNVQSDDEGLVERMRAARHRLERTGSFLAPLPPRAPPLPIKARTPAPLSDELWELIEGD